MCTERQFISLDELFTSDYESVIVTYQRQLDVARDQGDYQTQGNILCDMAEFYNSVGEPERSIVCYDIALDIARALGDSRGESVVLSGMGTAYSNVGDTKRAFQLQQEALTIARQLRHRPLQCHALVHLGNTYGAFGQYQKAIESYEQYIEIAQDIGDSEGENLVSWNIALIYEQQGDVKKAKDLMQTCLKRMRMSGYADIDTCEEHYKKVRQKVNSTSNGHSNGNGNGNGHRSARHWWFW